MTPLHFSAFGPADALSARERRAARALIDETIRHELAVDHAAHWPRHRPSGRRLRKARRTAHRQQLLVVTVPSPSGRRVLAAATCTSTAASAGSAASAALRVTRWMTKGSVFLATVVALLAARHGHVGLSVLMSVGLLVAVVVAPSIAWCRRRLSDRVLAARGNLLLGRPTRAGERLVVLHHLTLPDDVDDGSTASTTTVVDALRPEQGAPWLIAPCCIELAQRYAGCRGVEWLFRHGRHEQMVLVLLARSSDEQRGSDGQVVALSRARSERRAAELEPV